MAQSDFLFERGRKTTTEAHGEHSFVFASGAPVTDSGRSDFVFESGVGIGGKVITATLYDEAGNILESISLEDSTYDTGGFGVHSGYEGGANYWDHWRRDTDGTIIDSWEEGDLSAYQGDTTEYVATTTRAKDGAYSVYVDPETTEFYGIYSQSGLDYYPQRGDPFRGWIYTEDGANRTALVRFAIKDWANNDFYQVGFDPEGDFVLRGPDGDRVKGGRYDQTGEWWEILVEW